MNMVGIGGEGRARFPEKVINLSTTHKFYVVIGFKRHLGQRDLIIGSMGYWGV